MSALEARLQEIAGSAVLLVVVDYDGTLAAIVPDPARARPLPEALPVLARLAGLPRTHVAVVSGRSLGELARLLGEPGGVHLIGSHGGEIDRDFASSLSDEQRRLREQVGAELAAIAARHPGAVVEAKPASRAFHFRNVAASEQEIALQEVLAGPAARAGVFTRHGKKVVELAVVDADKGRAVLTLRRQLGASAVLFFGDDVTDEDAFATLCGPDLGVKVGEGATRAHLRVSEPRDVVSALRLLADLRARGLAESEAQPARGGRG